MLDIAKLERRWLKYKIKSILPYALLVLLITILVFTVPMILSYNASSTALVSTKKLNPTSNTPTPSHANNDENSMILEPSMQFLQSMNVPSPSIESVSSTPISAVPAKISTPQPKIEAAVLPPIVKPLQVPVQKGKLTSIKRDDAAFDIHELEERFKNNSNPNLGLYIARYHYDHANYPESYNYALKTNAINSTMEESWLIFAKSLVKLGKEDQAKKTLQLYISNSNSQNAKNYLDTLSKEPSK
jgi:hypothetical protein